MMGKQTDPSLLEMLARQMGCTYLSDLKYLDPGRRRVLADLVRGVKSRAVPCDQWNDALTYLGGTPCPSPEQAHRALLALLDGPA